MGAGGCACPAGATVFLRYTEGFKSFTPIILPGVVIVESTPDFRFQPVPEAEARAELANTRTLAAE